MASEFELHIVYNDMVNKVLPHVFYWSERQCSPGVLESN
jgi:hypothetical protein